MIFETLHDSAERGELMLVEGGMCHWHLRNDGQLTIREIISTKKGAGSLILRRLEATLGATSLFAKCPADLPANWWYTRRGFYVERMETTKSGRKLICWRKSLDTPKHLPNNAGGIQLFYCAGKNSRLDEIALDAGWYLGIQAPNHAYYRPLFVDQNWKNPNREKYMQALAEHRPYMATVLDWEESGQFDEVMSWATEAAQYVSVVVIIPKVSGEVWRVPDMVAGKPVRLGYSVPTSYGGTTVPLAEFWERPVHLLGGSPHKQLELASVLNAVSVDCNLHAERANNAQYWTPKFSGKARNPYYPQLQEVDGWKQPNAPYEAFRRSCNNIRAAWEVLEAKRLAAPDVQLAMAI